MAIFNQEVQNFIKKKLTDAKILFERALCELDVENRISFAETNLRIKEIIEKIKPCEYNLRIAAESAWGATTSAIDALVSSELEDHPTIIERARTESLKQLVRDFDTSDLKEIWDKYNSRMVLLHGKCFYNGECYDPLDRIKERIESTDELLKLINNIINNNSSLYNGLSEI